MIRIEVLGMGCAKYQATMGNAEQAVQEMGIQMKIVKVEDLGEIVARRVMMTPALATMMGCLSPGGRFTHLALVRLVSGQEGSPLGRNSAKEDGV